MISIYTALLTVMWCDGSELYIRYLPSCPPRMEMGKLTTISIRRDDKVLCLLIIINEPRKYNSDSFRCVLRNSVLLVHTHVVHSILSSCFSLHFPNAQWVGKVVIFFMWRSSIISVFYALECAIRSCYKFFELLLMILQGNRVELFRCFESERKVATFKIIYPKCLRRVSFFKRKFPSFFVLSLFK